MDRKVWWCLKMDDSSPLWFWREICDAASLRAGFYVLISSCKITLLLPDRWSPSQRCITWHLHDLQDLLTWKHSEWCQVLSDDDRPGAQISERTENERMWIFISSFVQTIISTEGDLSLTSRWNLDLHWAHPPRLCVPPFPWCCCKGKVSGPAAGRTAWGKSSATKEKKPV